MLRRWEEEEKKINKKDERWVIRLKRVGMKERTKEKNREYKRERM